MSSTESQTLRLASGLFLAVFLWGGNNAGVRYLVQEWPPVFTGCTRFLCAGFLLAFWLRHGKRRGEWQPVPPSLQRPLWWRGGFSLAAYIVVFNEALRHTSASHVAVLLAAAPIWALLWEGGLGNPRPAWRPVTAALLGLTGVGVLVAPDWTGHPWHWRGELLGLGASILWAQYGWQSRWLSQRLPAAEVTAQSMWRAGVWLTPLAGMELWTNPIAWRADLMAVQAYCVLAGGVAAFGLWIHALRHWETSRVLLFNNLIPVTTMLWAGWFLNEKLTVTFLIALALILGGVWLGQTRPPGLHPRDQTQGREPPSPLAPP